MRHVSFLILFICINIYCQDKSINFNVGGYYSYDRIITNYNIAHDDTLILEIRPFTANRGYELRLNIEGMYQCDIYNKIYNNDELQLIYSIKSNIDLKLNELLLGWRIRYLYFYFYSIDDICIKSVELKIW